MAIAPTGDIYKAFSFDNTSSRNFGVYITGAAVYNAPERDVEMVTVPGRNGNLVVDNGRFENIEVTYPAGIFAETEADFAQAISDLRNFLCSKKGYCRLTDEYNPNEYRLGIYKSGLEVEPSQLKAGEFELIFDCKPQRFLTSGETSVEITSGGTVTNPTLFESSPLLEIEGYGNIDIAGQPITINNQPIGTVLLKNKQTNAYYVTEIDTSSLEPGDTITIKSLYFYIWWYDTIKITGSGGSLDYGLDIDVTRINSTTSVDKIIWLTIPTVTKGTSFSQSWEVESSIEDSTGEYVGVFRFTLSYDGNDTIRFYYATVSYTHTGTKSVKYTLSRDIGAIYGDSTMPTLGNPIYCDLDIGEAYKFVGGEPVSVNSGVVFPPALPTLKTGLNTITYDNTITSLDVTPRWWKI